MKFQLKAPSKKFIWNCLINPNLKLDGCEKVQIIQKVDKLDEDFIYKCLTDQNVGLNSYDKFELIQIIYKDEKDIYKYISDPKIGFNRKYKIMLAMMLDEENFWSKYMPFVMKQEVKAVCKTKKEWEWMVLKINYWSISNQHIQIKTMVFIRICFTVFSNPNIMACNYPCGIQEIFFQIISPV